MNKEEKIIYQRAYRQTDAGKKARSREWAKNYQKYKEKWKEYKNFLFELRVEKGGKCVVCSFDKEIKILHFHHLRDKEFEVCSYRGKITDKVRARIRKEAEKCILLCPNCHAITHLK